MVGCWSVLFVRRITGKIALEKQRLPLPRIPTVEKNDQYAMHCYRSAAHIIDYEKEAHPRLASIETAVRRPPRMCPHFLSIQKRLVFSLFLFPHHHHRQCSKMCSSHHHYESRSLPPINYLLIELSMLAIDSVQSFTLANFDQIRRRQHLSPRS